VEPRDEHASGHAAPGGGSAPSVAAALRALAPPLAALLIAGFGIAAVFGGRQTDFEELALGRETSVFYARENGVPIHCRDMRDLEDCLGPIRARAGARVALWLGNSQIHSINQYQPGQETAPAMLHRRLRGAGLELLTLSVPSANLQEHYVLFEYLRQHADLERLILPVVFDDFREDGLRATVAPALADPATRAALLGTAAGADIARRQELAGAAAGDLAGLAETVQERVEGGLDAWLQENWGLWALRPQMRGDVINSLYTLRNRLFGIKTSSVRRQIPARYERNLAALRATLESARRAGVEVTLYMAPLRSDRAIPYDAAEYAGFRRDVEAVAREGGARYLDFQDLVPARYFGQWASVGGEVEDDYKHFQVGGHALLAEALGAALDGRTDGAAR
jgi:hypothetical protein